MRTTVRTTNSPSAATRPHLSSQSIRPLKPRGAFLVVVPRPPAGAFFAGGRRLPLGVGEVTGKKGTHSCQRVTDPRDTPASRPASGHASTPAMCARHEPSMYRGFATRGYIATIGLMARRAETIELAVLGLLHEGPMHGYELRKRLNLMLGWGRVLSYGSLYPTLKKMLRAHLIEEETASVTPVTRRPRIVYQLTEAGEREVGRLM